MAVVVVMDEEEDKDSDDDNDETDLTLGRRTVARRPMCVVAMKASLRSSSSMNA